MLTKHLHNIDTTSAQGIRRGSTMYKCYTNILCLLGMRTIIVYVTFQSRLSQNVCHTLQRHLEYGSRGSSSSLLVWMVAAHLSAEILRIKLPDAFIVWLVMVLYHTLRQERWDRRKRTCHVSTHTRHQLPVKLFGYVSAWVGVKIIIPMLSVWSWKVLWSFSELH